MDHPVLFFSSIWAGEIFTRHAIALDPTQSATDEALNEDSSRVASRALFYSSILSLVASIFMPFIVSNETGRRRRPPFQAGGEGVGSGQRNAKWWKNPVNFHLADVWAFSQLVFALSMGARPRTSQKRSKP
jgi:solute carrier family 45, member 1/2/4